MPYSRISDRPIILGIVGDSAAGKTTMARGIANMLGPERVVMLCSDDYHRYDRAERMARKITALDPRANYMDILEQHIQLLRQGKPILKPVYNHEDGTLGPPEHIEPHEYIIVEGLLGYSTRAMRDCSFFASTCSAKSVMSRSKFAMVMTWNSRVAASRCACPEWVMKTS